MDAEGFDAYFDELLGLDTAPPAEAPQTTSATRGLGPGAAEASQTTPGPRELVPAASNPRSPARSVLARLPARSPGAEKTALAAVEKLDQFAPLRAGDPLALGGERPKPPADPEAYDPEREAKTYTRSLYDAKTREQLRADGFFSIEEVRELVKSNSVKGAAEGGDLAFTLDAELIILVDSRTNFKVFVTDDNV